LCVGYTAQLCFEEAIGFPRGACSQQVKEHLARMLFVARSMGE
jgi:hypothetical protein